EVVIQFDSLERRSVGLGAKLFLWQYVISDKSTVTACQLRIDERVTRINRNSLLVVFDGFLCILVSALNPKIATLEVEVKRLGVDGTDLGELLLLGIRQTQTQLPGDLTGDLGFNSKQVCRLAVVSFAPNLCAIAGVNKLNADYQIFAPLLNSSGHDGLNSESLGYFLRV